jgi:lysine/ornithine N-monooxygenase
MVSGKGHERRRLRGRARRIALGVGKQVVVPDDVEARGEVCSE